MRTSTNHRYLERIERVIDALLAAPADAHSVESLAALAHMSEYHFHRVFRALMGETVQTTMRRVRLVFAADRLAAGAESVARIANAAGYESPQAFARAFRSYTRSTPGEFRRRHRHVSATAHHCCSVGDADIDLVDEPAREPGGRYARYVLRGPASMIAPAFRAMQRDWLPPSDFALDDRPLLERYVEPCSDCTRGEEAITELLIPIRARSTAKPCNRGATND